MKKRIFGRKFSRAGKSRKALLRSLARSLVLYGSIMTTSAKAKTIHFYVENIINIAKGGDLAARRRVYAKLGNDRDTTDKIFNIILPLFKSRVGGYLRVIPMSARRGDAAEMAKVEWVEKVSEDKRKEDKSDKSKDDVEKKGKNVVKNTVLKRIKTGLKQQEKSAVKKSV